MALSKNTQYPFEIGDLNELPVLTNVKIYENSLVGIDAGTGYARPLTAGDAAQGFAESPADNTGGASGAMNVRVKYRGLVQVAVGSLAITDIGKPVYASDDGTFTLTATSNSYVGKVYRFVSSGVGVVAFDFSIRRSITALTDSSGGTAADTIAAIGGTYSQAEVRNAIASLAAKVNTLIATSK